MTFSHQGKFSLNTGLYQLKVDVGMLNTVKNYSAGISSVSPSSEQKRVLVSVRAKQPHVWTVSKITCFIMSMQYSTNIKSRKLSVPST